MLAVQRDAERIVLPKSYTSAHVAVSRYHPSAPQEHPSGAAASLHLQRVLRSASGRERFPDPPQH